MILNNINNFKNGWLIGNFDPSLFKTKNFEVAIHSHNKGFIGTPHYHTSSTEYNVIINGSMIINEKKIKSGDIFILEKNEISNGEFLEDTILMVIRIPSINDKVII